MYQQFLKQSREDGSSWIFHRLPFCETTHKPLKHLRRKVFIYLFTFPFTYIFLFPHVIVLLSIVFFTSNRIFCHFLFFNQNHIFFSLCFFSLFLFIAVNSKLSFWVFYFPSDSFILISFSLLHLGHHPSRWRAGRRRHWVGSYPLFFNVLSLPIWSNAPETIFNIWKFYHVISLIMMIFFFQISHCHLFWKHPVTSVPPRLCWLLPCSHPLS